MSILKGIKLKGDETIHQLDYEEGIGNKPFYVDGMEYVEHDELMSSQEFTFKESTDGEYYASLENPILMKKDNAYRVTWDGTSYDCICKEYLYGDGVLVHMLGNGKISGDEYEESSEPFAIGTMANIATSIMTNDTATTHTVRVVEVEEVESIHYLDSKFIKDMYGSNGMKEVDVLPYKLLNFSQDAVFSAFHSSYIEPTTSGMPFAIEAGKKYSVLWDGQTYECEGFNASLGEVSGVALGNTTLFDFGDDTGEPFVISYIPQSMANAFFTLDTAGTHFVRIYEVVEDIEYINPKFIQGMYSAEVVEGEKILPKQSFIFEAENSVIYSAIINKNFTLIEGETYRVTFDDIDYDCVCGMYGDTMYLGNARAISNQLETTTHPFLVAIQNSSTATAGIFTFLKGVSHIVGITKLHEIIKQIPSKYVDGYTKNEIDTMFGTYVTEVDALLGGE